MHEGSGIVLNRACADLILRHLGLVLGARLTFHAFRFAAGHLHVTQAEPATYPRPFATDVVRTAVAALHCASDFDAIGENDPVRFGFVLGVGIVIAPIHGAEIFRNPDVSHTFSRMLQVVHPVVFHLLDQVRM
jgi:hypothetical protein